MLRRCVSLRRDRLTFPLNISGGAKHFGGITIAGRR